MRKKEYDQLISELILLPFIHTEYNESDYLVNYAKAYCELIDGTGRLDLKAHADKKKNLADAKKQILYSFSRDNRWNHLDDAQMLIDAFYPGYKLRLNYNKEKNDLGKFYLKRIFEIARTFITFRDGVVAIRNWADETIDLIPNFDGLRKVELWNYISRIMLPDIFIAACYIKFGITEAEMLYNVPNLISMQDVPLSKVLKKGVAETHMHFNAGISYSFLWQQCMELFDCKDKDFNLWFCTLFRIYSSIYIESELEESYEKYLTEKLPDILKTEIYEDFLKNNICKKLDEYVFEINNFKNILYDFYNKKQGDNWDILYETVLFRYRNQGISSEILWYFKILSYLNKKYDAELCRQFMMYIRFKNEFISKRIQQNKIGGLDYFHTYYDNATNVFFDKAIPENIIKRKMYRAIFEEQCRTGNMEILEIKISPRVISSSKVTLMSEKEMQTKTLSQIKLIFGAYSDYIENTVNRTQYPEKLRFPKLGIIYHFIKQNDCDNFSGYNCVKKDGSKKYDCLDYTTMRNLNIQFVKSLKSLFKTYPLLTDYIVGIDAASIENSAEPWVFAPIFREIRNNDFVIPTSLSSGKRVPNIGLTYHVGEDFRHIISGLRHIDEVLTHFNYCSGDRLGHAIALGVDIDRLFSQNRVVALPIIEHLENLLWMWGRCKASNIINAPQNLEFVIMETAKKIYGDKEIENISVYTLWQVYNDKFNLYNNCNGDCDLKVEIEKPDGIKWNRSTLLCSHYCPCFFEKYHKPVFVKISDEEIAFCKSLQNDLIAKVEELGIYVETNPSSNLAIGDIEDIYTHPILNLNCEGLRLDDRDTNCVMTTINSDDPIVFSTCVENEISYIYYALLNAGVKRERALVWIDKIRCHGISSSFVKYEKTYEDMLSDFKEIEKYNI